MCRKEMFVIDYKVKENNVKENVTNNNTKRKNNVQAVYIYWRLSSSGGKGFELMISLDSVRRQHVIGGRCGGTDFDWLLGRRGWGLFAKVM